MTDLRSLPRVLVGRGDIVTPPVTAVVQRARRTRTRRAGVAVALGLVLVVLGPSVVQWITDGDESSHVRLVDRTTTTTMSTAGPGGQPQAVVTAAAALPRSVPASPPGTTPWGRALECRAGANGGGADVGVTADTIRIVMTETLEFPTRYVTATAYSSVRALFEYVNQRGGICGRRIELRYANDAWRPLPWDADGDMLAAIAGPLDTNVDGHVVDGSIDRAGVPLVGTDGLTAAHHRSPWVWPIGPSTASFTRIAVEHAYRSGARSFALVYDRNGPVGTQAAEAFDGYVKRLSDATVKHMQPLDSSASDYTTEARAFNRRCGLGACDLVLFALFPETATKWMAEKPALGRRRTATLPLLLDTSFWRACPKGLLPTSDRRELRLDRQPITDHVSISKCTGFHVWNASPRFDASYWSEPLAPCRYVQANPLVAVANLSACTIMEALQRMGPDVTRARLRQAIDEVAYRSGLVASFGNGRRVPDGRAGQATARAWKPVYNLQGDFERLEAITDAVRDPTPGEEPG